MKAVILAGGTGSRLWPMSRDLKPKQFHCFTGNQTMLQNTYARLSFLEPSDIYVSTNEQYRELVRSQLRKIAKSHIVVEPDFRDTGPCICFAASQLEKMGYADEIIAVVYADHLIQKPQELKRALLFSEEYVKNHNVLAVIAVRAKYANTNLGYIKIGSLKENCSEGFEVYELEQFVEKPTTEDAREFLNSYKYMWNTGLYISKVSHILAQFKKYAPDVFAAACTEAGYKRAPKISIDYCLMEKLPPSELHVIPADLGWNDIGNWAALHEELTDNENENIGSGDHLEVDTQGSIILGNSGKLVVTYGLKNIVVVDTPEALLVMPKEKAADVKKVIEALKKDKKERFL